MIRTLFTGPGDANARKLYFHSFASFRESWVPVSVLKDTKLIENADQLRPKIVMSEEARDGQSTVEVMTNDGILLFADIPKSAIMCWNQKTEYKKENIHVAYQVPNTHINPPLKNSFSQFTLFCDIFHLFDRTTKLYNSSAE